MMSGGRWTVDEGDRLMVRSWDLGSGREEGQQMFSAEERDRVREWIVELARNDARVTGGALIGSLAVGAVDRWSDIDVTFGVADGVHLEAVLDDWGEALQREFGVVHYW